MSAAKVVPNTPLHAVRNNIVTSQSPNSLEGEIDEENATEDSWTPQSAHTDYDRSGDESSVQR